METERKPRAPGRLLCRKCGRMVRQKNDGTLEAHQNTLGAVCPAGEKPPVPTREAAG